MAIIVEHLTPGAVKIESLAQDSDLLFLNKKAGNSGDALRIDNAGDSHGIHVVQTDATLPAVFIGMNVAGNLALRVRGSDFITASFQAGSNTANHTVEIVNNTGGTGPCLRINENDNGVGIVIDSEAASKPLIELAPIPGNSRGDIAFGTARTAAPSTPSEGDLWYDGTLERFGFKTGGTTLPRTIISRYGPNINERKQGIVIDGAGAATFGEGVVELNANTGVTDDLVSLVASPTASFGDTVMLFAAAGDTITVKGTGNIRLDGAADKVLNTVNDLLYLFFDGTNYLQIAFSNNP